MGCHRHGCAATSWQSTACRLQGVHLCAGAGLRSTGCRASRCTFARPRRPDTRTRRGGCWTSHTRASGSSSRRPSGRAALHACDQGLPRPHRRAARDLRPRWRWARTRLARVRRARPCARCRWPSLRTTATMCACTKPPLYTLLKPFSTTRSRLTSAKLLGNMSMHGHDVKHLATEARTSQNIPRRITSRSPAPPVINSSACCINSPQANAMPLVHPAAVSCTGGWVHARCSCRWTKSGVAKKLSTTLHLA